MKKNVTVAGSGLRKTCLRVLIMMKLRITSYNVCYTKLLRGKFPIVFKSGKKEVAEYQYELRQREPHSGDRIGFNSSDVIYLITPDRFANGNPDNDEIVGMKEKPNRGDKDGRHGGDFRITSYNVCYTKLLRNPGSRSEGRSFFIDTSR